MKFMNDRCRDVLIQINPHVVSAVRIHYAELGNVGCKPTLLTWRRPLACATSTFMDLQFGSIEAAHKVAVSIIGSGAASSDGSAHADGRADRHRPSRGPARHPCITHGCERTP